MCSAADVFGEGMTITAAQCCAARALLNWSQEELVQHSNTTRKIVADFERGATRPQPRNMAQITAAFEASGIKFLKRRGRSADRTPIARYMIVIGDLGRIVCVTFFLQYLADAAQHVCSGTEAAAGPRKKRPHARMSQRTPTQRSWCSRRIKRLQKRLADASLVDYCPRPTQQSTGQERPT